MTPKAPSEMDPKKREIQVRLLKKQLRVVSAFGIKGGCGKSTLTLVLASGLKRLYPEVRIGIIDMTTEQATLSGVFALEQESRGQGWWAITKAYLDEVERDINPDLVTETIRKAVVPLVVIPGTPQEEDGIVEFIGCGKRQLRAIEGHRDLSGAEAVVTCAGVLQAIQETLGWDLVVVDLPPSTKEIGSRMMLGNCSAVAVTAGLTHRDDLSGYPAMVSEIRRMEIEPAGLLLNRWIPKDTYSELALAEVRAISANLGLPELGLIRERQTLKSSREPYEWQGQISQTAVGLYLAQTDTRLNETTRAGIQHTIHEVETAARAVVDAIQAAEGPKRVSNA